MKWSVGAVVLLLTLVSAGAQAEGPLPVSPGGQAEMAVVAGRCPTFHWTAVEGAESVDLVVYRLLQEEADGPPEQVLSVALPGSAHGWTPSLGQCLEPGGRYAWSVGVQGAWSEASLFEVSAAPSVVEVEEAMAVLRRYLGDTNVGSAAPEEVTLGPDALDRRVDGGQETLVAHESPAGPTGGIRIGGKPVLSGYERVVGAPHICPAGSLCSAVANCPFGKVALGGGVNSTKTTRVYVTQSYPSADSSWTLQVHNTLGSDAIWEIWITCADTL
jgi:hypothetical protein